MFRKLLGKLGEQTSIAIVLRKIVELNFRKQKSAIKHFLSLSPGERILDVGCGTGEFAPLFRVEDYTGVDIDPSNIGYATRHYPHHFEMGDALALPFQDASFSAVLVAGVLHHLSLQDCERMLSEIKRVLKPGGKALIMEDTRSRRLLTRLMHRLDQGAFIRTKQEWDMLLGNSFTIQQTWTFNSGMCFYSAFFLHA